MVDVPHLPLHILFIDFEGFYYAPTNCAEMDKSWMRDKHRLLSKEAEHRYFPVIELLAFAERTIIYLTSTDSGLKNKYFTNGSIEGKIVVLSVLNGSIIHVT
ncbi:hypothetical protein QJS10_CPB12g00759 [Acorus calamus]|uniref:Uncharacterized protein n=1 Tax=Acorus calamus TaxID=4465 RepID=A0AAV9DMY4_ACOCL|nr:hypothetical protein QJS10_CPB12g00759 [Acorus calamus]